MREFINQIAAIEPRPQPLQLNYVSWPQVWYANGRGASDNQIQRLVVEVSLCPLVSFLLRGERLSNADGLPFGLEAGTEGLRSGL